MGTAAAPAKAMAETAKCVETHRVRFFCEQCDRLFCSDCYMDAHMANNREHEAKKIEECIERGVRQVGTQMDELKRIADGAETAANARDQKANESYDTFIQLVAGVERLNSASTREAQQLRRLSRDSFAELQ